MGLGDDLNKGKKNADDINKSMKGTARSTKDAADNMGRFNDEAQESESAFGDVRSVLEKINEELGKKINRVKDASKSYTQLTSIAAQLQNQEEGSLRLTDKKLNKLAEQAKVEKANIERAANALMEENTAAKAMKGLKGKELKTQIELQKSYNRINDEQAALLTGLSEGFKIEEDAVNLVSKEVEIRKKSNKLLGIGGGLAKAMNKFGGAFSESMGLDEVVNDMTKMADELARSEDSATGLGSKIKVLGAGAKTAFSNLAASMTDPSVIFGALIKGFNAVDKEATDFARQTGQDMNTVSTSLATVNMGYVNMADYIKAAGVLTKDLKMNATDIFSQEDILEVAQMTDEMGMAGDSAAKLAQLSQLNGMSVRKNNETIIQGVNSYNKQTKSAINSRKVLDDISNTSQGVLIKFAGMPGELAKASSAAAGIGMNLEQVDKIAGSLLNFEESISNEMEAELLTGKNLNLEKARQAALDNDLATVAKELSKQVGSSAEFSKMNRIQQEATAKAMGMTTDEVAGMLLQEDMRNGLQESSLNAAQKQTLESQKNRAAQDRIAQSVAKIGQAFAPIIGFIADIVANSFIIYSIMGVALLSKLGGISKTVGNIGKGFSSAKDGVKSFFKFTEGGMKGMMDKTKKYGETLSNAFKGGQDAGKKFYKGGQFMPGGGRAPKGGAFSKIQAPKGLDKGADTIGKSADKTKGIKGNAGKGIKQFLKGLGDGLASIGKQFGNVVKGGIALGLSLLAIGGGFALALPLIANTDPAQMLAFAGAISMLGITVAIMGKMGGSVIKGALALGILAVALIPAAFAFSLLAGVDVNSMIAFSIAVPLLALAAAGLGFLAPYILLGSLAIAALGLAIIPAAMAFGMLEGVDTQVILSFATGIGVLAGTAALLGLATPFILAGSVALIALGLALIPISQSMSMIGDIDPRMIGGFVAGILALGVATAGLGFMSPFIIAGAGALTVLGLSLIPLATAFTILASADMEGMFNTLTTVGSIAPQLFSVGAGLFSIAAGLGAMALTGFLALPVLGALTALGAVSGGLGSMFGGDEDTGGGENAILSEKLDQVNSNILKLISVVEAGGDVIIDGAVAGKTISMASSGIG